MRGSEGGSRVLEQGHRYADGGFRRGARTRVPARTATATALAVSVAPRDHAPRDHAPRPCAPGLTTVVAGTDRAPRSFDLYLPDARVASVRTDRRAPTGTAPASETATQ